ncbi:hypothetical protein ACLOJK_039126 [Asimina triloba]
MIVAAELGIGWWQGYHGCPVAHGRTALGNRWPNVAVSCPWTLELGLLVARCRWVSPAGGLDVGASAVGKADRDGAVGVNGKNGKRRWCGCWRRTGGEMEWVAGGCWIVVERGQRRSCWLRRLGGELLVVADGQIWLEGVERADAAGLAGVGEDGFLIYLQCVY